MNMISKLLPDEIGTWRRSEPIQIIDSTNIFDYMNGGGELYLGYRFNHLEVCEYRSEVKNNILVEIYEMETSDDAFGLLSLDWSGEPLDYAIHNNSDSALSPGTRALYGGGLLRFSSGKHYARVMAARETAEARNTIIQIGKILSNEFSPEPEIVQLLPSLDSAGWKINKNKIAFFRSHLALNSLFYISHRNILNLNHSVAAVTTIYHSVDENVLSKTIQIFVMEYSNHQNAVEALNHFCQEFLPEDEIRLNTNNQEYTNYFSIEEGWMACKMDSRYLSLIFNLPDKLIAAQIMNHIKIPKHKGD